MFKLLKRAPRLLAPVARMYGRRLDQCGTTAKGVFWRDDHWHEKRFIRLSEAFTAEHTVGGGITINDLGCGYGAFFDFIQHKPVMRGSRYFGYDIAQEMIAACRDRIDDPRAKFLRKMEATQNAEYSFACGTYNLKGHADPADWHAYIEDSLVRLWGRTTVCLAFNMLREDESEKYQGLYYIDPSEMERFCKETLSANVHVVDERPMPDVTYFVRR